MLQAGVYLSALAFAGRLADNGISLRQARRLATPNGQQLLDLMESVLGLDAWLVQSILFGNRFVETPWRSERAFAREFKRLKEALA